MFVQRASTSQIPPDVPVDGLVADRQLSFQAQVTGDLFGTPLFPQQPFHSLPVPTSKLAVAPRPITPRVGPLLRASRSIPSIVGRRVAFEFPRHCAAVAPKLARDLRLLQSHQAQRRQRAPLSSTQLPILHPHSSDQSSSPSKPFFFPSLHTSSVLHLVCESATSNQAMERTVGAPDRAPWLQGLCFHPWPSRTKTSAAVRFHQRNIGSVDRAVGVHVAAEGGAINQCPGVDFGLADVAGVDGAIAVHVRR